jgi:phosphoglycolate phosphatase
MKVDTVIFDLDGTLIDSSASIISSIKAAFVAVGVEQIKPITASSIGPPLPEIMQQLVMESDAGALPDLIKAFKRHYDEIGYKDTIVYEGVLEALLELRRNGLNTYIATNKRLHATKKIINHLGWGAYFKDTFSLDYFNPPISNKTSMLKIINSLLPGKSANRVYIGDRAEDAEAARQNNIAFLWATWGYGLMSDSTDCCAMLKSPVDLKSILLKPSLLKQ